MKTSEIEVAILGGGLAGLVSAHLLAQSGQKVMLFEKKSYPFHRVCGEYLSAEVLGFLEKQRLLPEGLDLPRISEFEYSDTNGKTEYISLDQGGIGVSRFVLDEWMAKRARESGAFMEEGVQVEEVDFLPKEDRFCITLNDGREFFANHVLGAFGKRSKLDKSMSRSFITQRSPYIGVKYHIRTDFDKSRVALHNFEGGYCGINAVEEGKYNLCYLGLSKHSKKFGSIEAMEREVLWKNPKLKHLWMESEFLFEKPEVISEISFEPKAPVENHVLMIGDAAGLITPLCGNGMAMAIRSGFMASELLMQNLSRPQLEQAYQKAWTQEFAFRLWVGRQSQKLFGSGKTSFLGRILIGQFPFLARQIIQKTHGKPF
ncbi:NAD(P)/FAD-dependent oxidoreductase [Algoriphagus mannitolivorans]|uniref:NAD(P)/FAD-dependent oxidoreductase n=1 Tax=Algoriphagus mannitolivorans TaxID=226504 RepID=UPI000478B091|nr:NAD(P)/FAD-dependent oxidoreductase [Algoriphagus mannitolivorans]